jgi:transcriptional regulator with XRE-family HTH domain
MGQSSRPRPKRLAQKLCQIRDSFALSQDSMVDHLGLRGKITRERISAYEQDEREPPLFVLLRYARAAGVWMDVLVDDELDLPAKLPSSIKSEGIPRKPASKRMLKPG